MDPVYNIDSNRAKEESSTGTVVKNGSEDDTEITLSSPELCSWQHGNLRKLSHFYFLAMGTPTSQVGSNRVRSTIVLVSCMHTK